MFNNLYCQDVFIFILFIINILFCCNLNSFSLSVVTITWKTGHQMLLNSNKQMLQWIQNFGCYILKREFDLFWEIFNQILNLLSSLANCRQKITHTWWINGQLNEKHIYFMECSYISLVQKLLHWRPCVSYLSNNRFLEAWPTTSNISQWRHLP